MRSTEPLTELDILRDVVETGPEPLSSETVKFLSNLHFSKKTQNRIRALLRASNKGKISDAQRAELERFLRVGQLVDLLKTKVRSLSKAQAA